MSPFRINFYTGIYLLWTLNPCVYLGPDVYMSPTFVRINTVCHNDIWIAQWVKYVNKCDPLSTLDLMHEKLWGYQR